MFLLRRGRNGLEHRVVRRSLIKAFIVDIFVAPALVSGSKDRFGQARSVFISWRVVVNVPNSPVPRVVPVDVKIIHSPSRFPRVPKEPYVGKRCQLPSEHLLNRGQRDLCRRPWRGCVLFRVVSFELVVVGVEYSGPIGHYANYCSGVMLFLLSCLRDVT